MNKKLSYIASLVVLFAMASGAFALNTVAQNLVLTTAQRAAATPAAPQDWFQATNWTLGTVPANDDATHCRGVTLYGSSATSYDSSGAVDSIIIAGGDAATGELRVGSNTPNTTAGTVGTPAALTMNSGTLTIGDAYSTTAYVSSGSGFMSVGSDSAATGSAGRNGLFYMNGGDIQALNGQGSITIGNGNTGSPANGCYGKMWMTGGTIECSSFKIGKNTGVTGDVYLSGGTITTAAFTMGTGTALLDITGSGKLIITGDVTATVQGYIDSGLITAYGGTAAGTRHVDYDVTNAGKTTVWATLPLPGQASSPSPANSVISISTTADLSWTAGSNATSYDVYFGTASPGTSQGNQTATTFDTGTMAASTTYYWRIDSKNATGTTTGDVWSFTTQAPLPFPSKPTSPSPANSATGVSTTADLSWTAGSDTTSYDVYFGTASPGASQGNQTATTFDTGTMTAGTTYYWRIDAKNATGTTTGDVWSFTTKTLPTASASITNPVNGQVMLAVGYDNGMLEFRDWQGNVLASRGGFGEVTAMDSYHSSDSSLPRLFVGSTDGGGTLRIINPANIFNDLAGRSGFTNITAIWAMGDCIYVGSTDAGGILRKLNSITLVDQAARSGFTEITALADVWNAQHYLLVGSTDSGGALRIVNLSTLVDVGSGRSGFGRIYALATDDIDSNGIDEIVVGSSDGGGAVRYIEADDINTDKALRCGFETIYSVGYGLLGVDQCNDNGKASIAVASSDGSGTVRVMDVNVSGLSTTLGDSASRSGFYREGSINIKDMYLANVNVLLVPSTDNGTIAAHIMDENLSDLTVFEK